MMHDGCYLLIHQRQLQKIKNTSLAFQGLTRPEREVRALEFFQAFLDIEKTLFPHLLQPFSDPGRMRMAGREFQYALEICLRCVVAI